MQDISRADHPNYSNTSTFPEQFTYLYLPKAWVKVSDLHKAPTTAHSISKQETSKFEMSHVYYDKKVCGDCFPFSSDSQNLMGEMNGTTFKILSTRPESKN
jgi:hypothetical protein